MTRELLDPWSDAAVIAERLSHHNARFVCVIGAEAWCETCRQFRPAFDASAVEGYDDMNVWLWLDLEEHAEFLGEFIPESLPLLIVYHGDRLTHALVPSDLTSSGLVHVLRQKSLLEYPTVPDMRARLATVDWAN